MLEVYIKRCTFQIAKGRYNLTQGRRKRFTTAEPVHVLLDMDNPDVKSHLDEGVYDGDTFDSLWKFLHGTKHTDFEENLLCFCDLRESKESGRRIYLFDHYAGSSEKYEYLYRERQHKELYWAFKVEYIVTRRMTLKRMGELFPADKVLLYAKQHHLLSEAMLKMLCDKK